MSERRWGKWTRDGVPKRWWQSMHRYTDAEVLAEMGGKVLDDWCATHETHHSRLDDNESCRRIRVWVVKEADDE